jgi:hypothetical protein
MFVLAGVMAMLFFGLSVLVIHIVGSVCSRKGEDFEVDESTLGEVRGRKGQKSEVAKTKSFYKTKSPG